jgi:Ca-activated chloride channel family protein
MVHLTQPWFLLLLPLVPLLVWCWWRQRRGALRYPHLGLLAGLPPGRARVARWGGAGLRAAGLVALLLALAGPRWPDLRTRINTEGIAITMLVDVSGSMAERDFHWSDERISRLDAVKRAFRLFVAGGDGPDGEHLEGRPEDLVGLVTFAARPESPCPLTLSHSVLLHLMDAEQPRSVPTESQTNIGDAIAWGLHDLHSAAARRKVLILLSDGEHNVPPPALKPRQAAQLAANLRVPIYAIDAGGDSQGQEAPSGERSQSVTDRAAGERTLQAVARITGGRYFRAQDTATLLAVCREIDRLERQEIPSYQYRRYYEGYPWLGLAALALFVTVQALEKTLWQRVP